MKSELEFLEYLEKQLISAPEKIYTLWIKQEISARKHDLEHKNCEQGDKNGE